MLTNGGDYITIQIKVLLLFLGNSHIFLWNLDAKLFTNVPPNCNGVIYAGSALQACLLSDRLVERVCKIARSKIHSLHPVGVNNSKISKAVSGTIWGKKRSSIFSLFVWTLDWSYKVSKRLYRQMPPSISRWTNESGQNHYL